MSSKYRRLAVRGRVAAIPAVAAAAIAGGVVGVTAASAHRVSAHAAAGTLSAKQLATIKKVVQGSQNAPGWSAPGPAVNGKKALSGKSIVDFPISSGIGACIAQQKYFNQAAAAMGAKVTPLASNAGPTSWSANLKTARSKKASAVVMFCGATAAAIAPDLLAMKSAHIPVVDGNYNQTGGNAAFPTTNLSAESGVNTAGGVTDDFLDALVVNNGKPLHILFLDSPSVAQYSGAKAALQAAIRKYSPASSIDREYDVQVQNWGNEQSQVQTDLQADTKINAVIVTFDGMTDDIVNTVQSAAATHPGLKIYAWGGGIAEIKNVHAGTVMAADSGPDERWDAYAQLDQVIRLLSHKAPASVAKETVPNILFTKSNAATFYSGSNYSDKAYSNGAFIKDYDRLWGVK